jgi:DNA repair protein RecO (recombination protein O)
VATVQTEAVVLRNYKLAEADKIVVLLTRDSGLIRGVARGARRLKSRFGASLEPFTVVSLTYYEKEERELVSIRQTEIITSSFTLAGDTKAMAILDEMAYLITKFVPMGEGNLRIYKMVVACLEVVYQLPEDILKIFLYFRLWLLKLSGFLPDFRDCYLCASSLLEGKVAYLKGGGRVICANCGTDGRLVDSNVIYHFNLMQRISPAKYADLEIGEETIKHVALILRYLIEHVLEDELRTVSSITINASDN